jgi:hypothetical protein
MDLKAYLNQAKKSLFRLELLQYFPSDEKLFASYKNTGEADKEIMAPWWAYLDDKKKAGIEMKRVRLVEYPLSDYMKMSLAVHKESSKHGMELFTIRGDEYRKLNIDIQDFWLVDDETVILMNYEKDGTYLGFDVKEDTNQVYSKIKNLLLNNSELVS